MSEVSTRGVRIQVQSWFVQERSDPGEGRYFFAYRVRIANESPQTVQLLRRRWVVTDGDGETKTVEGEGVVGEQPVLAPGGEFDYTSFCPLPTPFGSMHGNYLMVTEDGELFEAEIAPFTLALPHGVN